MVVFGFTSAISISSLFAQVYTDTLGDLVANNGTLTIGDKTFSEFGWTPSGAAGAQLGAQAANLVVSASIVNGIYYLDYSGLIAVNNLIGAGSLSGQLLLSYTVTANAGSIAMIDQNYTPNALPVQGNQIIIGETVRNVGGVIVGNSTLMLNPSDFSDPNPEPGDNLNINPSANQLFVVKDIVITAAPGQLVGLSDVAQSFHQVPEPGTLLLGSLGGGLLLLLRLRHQARRD